MNIMNSSIVELSQVVSILQKYLMDAPTMSSKRQLTADTYTMGLVCVKHENERN